MPAALIMAAVLAGLLVGCGSNSSDDRSKAAAESLPIWLTAEDPLIPEFKGKPVLSERMGIRQTHWRVIRIAGPKEVRILSSVGYCVEGESPPVYVAYRAVGRGKKLYITPYVAQLRRQTPSTICRGVGFTQEGTILLERPIGDVELYDATTSPPSLRWPLPAKE
jgi:hypothetical protein